jgi:hypothetical protein
VITSVENGRAVLTNSFLLLGQEEAKRFEDELLEVIENNEALQIKPFRKEEYVHQSLDSHAAPALCRKAIRH